MPPKPPKDIQPKRFCQICKRTYPTPTIHCSHCGGVDTWAYTESAPIQYKFFILPPAPPEPIAWMIEWKRNGKTLSWYLKGSGTPDDWEPKTSYPITSLQSARSKAAHWRRIWKDASFRIRPIQWRDDTPAIARPWHTAKNSV